MLKEGLKYMCCFKSALEGRWGLIIGLVFGLFLKTRCWAHYANIILVPVRGLRDPLSHMLHTFGDPLPFVLHMIYNICGLIPP